MNLRWAEKYVGIIFVDHGRTVQGTDCWGLVRLVLKEQCGVDVPSYGEISATELLMVTKTISQEANREPWHTVKIPKAFDVALMRGRPLHVGIMISDKQILHIEKKTASVLLPLTHASIKPRLLGFRRHNALLVELV